LGAQPAKQHEYQRKEQKQFRYLSQHRVQEKQPGQTSSNDYDDDLFQLAYDAIPALPMQCPPKRAKINLDNTRRIITLNHLKILLSNRMLLLLEFRVQSANTSKSVTE
jgi:hypothetical protein